MSRLPFTDVLAAPGYVGLLVVSLLARAPMIAIGLPMAFRAEAATGSMAWAGVVVGMHTVGTAVTAPAWARLAHGRRGARRAVALGFGWSCGVAAVAVVPGTWASLLPVLAGLTGVATPPVTAMVRSAWPRVLPDRLHPKAYTLDATTTDVLFAAAPLAATAMLSVTSPGATLVLIAGWAAISTVAVVRQLPPDGNEQRARAARATWRDLLAQRHRLPLLVAFALIMAAFGTYVIGTVSYADALGQPVLAGWVQAACAVGSVAGGMIVTARSPRRPVHAYRRAIMLGGGMALTAVAASWTPWAVAVAALVAGCAAAPTFGAVYERLGSLTPNAYRTEIFGWMLSSGLIGHGAGSALGGAVGAVWGAPFAFAAAAACAALACLTLVAVPSLVPARQAADTAPAAGAAALS